MVDLKKDQSMESLRHDTRDASLSVISAIQLEFPLRMLINSDMLGSIIGQKGSRIKRIKNETNTRIYIYTTEQTYSAITIYGNPKSCTKACKKILKTVHGHDMRKNKEKSFDNVKLMIMAHNNLISRIIEIQGFIINQLKTETNTNIYVRGNNTLSTFLYEKVIHIHGSLKNVINAEAQISAKFREQFEMDRKLSFADNPQKAVHPGFKSINIMSLMVSNCENLQRYQPKLLTTLEVTTFFWIPISAIKSIIDDNGFNVDEMIKYTGATAIEIEHTAVQNPEPVYDVNGVQKRICKIKIVGKIEVQFKAQSIIFCILYSSGIFLIHETIPFTVETLVQSNKVKNIIGIKSIKLNELEIMTGTTIEFQRYPSPLYEDTSIASINGHFLAIQAQQSIWYLDTSSYQERITIRRKM